jgi:hypothetical protein
MIIISSPTPQVGEIETIHSLENGLELLHVRKPEFTKLKWKFCFSLDKNIETYFHCTVIINWQKHLELIAFILEKNEMKHPKLFEGLERTRI